MSKTKSSARRFIKALSFFKVFFSNKQGAIGVIIILGFAFMALGAPLLTDHDPILDVELAGHIAAPLWLKYLPTYLGGEPWLSENLYGVSSSFDDGISGWNWTDVDYTSVGWNESFGLSGGSLQVQFKRDETGVLYNKSKIIVYYNFSFPYESSPDTFKITSYISATGTSHLENVSSGSVFIVNSTQNRFEVIPSVKLFIQRNSDGAKWAIWPLSTTPNYTKAGVMSNAPLGWFEVILTAKDYDVRSIAFNNPTDVASYVFKNVPGNFTYGMEITFDDTYNSTIPVETNVYLDQAIFYCPGKAYGLLGTDSQGRDLFSQLVYGSQISLYVGLMSAVISVSIGLLVGLAAGFLGKAVDEVLMRFTDLLLVIPFLPLLLVLVAIFGPTMQNLVIIIGILGWMGFARVVRAQVLSLRERSFIEAAKAIGAGRIHIMLRHILPNVMSLVYVTLAAAVPGAITAEAALGFLGFFDPSRISWGRMLNDAEFVGGGALNWWWVVFPGLCIALLAMAFILLGFALDELLNPKLRLRR